MTQVQTHPRPTVPALGHRTVTSAVHAAGPQVWVDMTVEVALSVMTAARTGHLVVCDEDGQYRDLVTRAGLTAVRDSSGYTDRVRLGDIGEDGLFAGHR